MMHTKFRSSVRQLPYSLVIGPGLIKKQCARSLDPPIIRYAPGNLVKPVDDLKNAKQSEYIQSPFAQIGV